MFKRNANVVKPPTYSPDHIIEREFSFLSLSFPSDSVIIHSFTFILLFRGTKDVLELDDLERQARRSFLSFFLDCFFFSVPLIWISNRKAKIEDTMELIKEKKRQEKILKKRKL